MLCGASRRVRGTSPAESQTGRRFGSKMIRGQKLLDAREQSVSVRAAALYGVAISCSKVASYVVLELGSVVTTAIVPSRVRTTTRTHQIQITHQNRRWASFHERNISFASLPW
jgi:hypothetical protein